MIYFSYNDFMDYESKGEIDKIRRVEEDIAQYEIKNEISKEEDNENRIINILKNKEELKNFLYKFLNFSYIEKITYCNNVKSILNKENNNIICKVNEKEMFIFIKVIEKIDNNIAYKMFENSLSIIKKWEKEEKSKDRRYPIVIPIVIYIGSGKWKNKNIEKHKKINYITYKDNKINFSYNIIKMNELTSNDLIGIKSRFVEDIINLKLNIYK